MTKKNHDIVKLNKKTMNDTIVPPVNKNNKPTYEMKSFSYTLISSKKTM